MKKWLLYLDLPTGIIGIIIGGCLTFFFIPPEGIVINAYIGFVAIMLTILLTILAWCYLLFRLFLKSIHRATNANTAFQRGAPMIKGLLSCADAFFSGIIGGIVGGCLAFIIKPEGIVINLNIELLAIMLTILLTILAWYYLLFRLKLKIMQLEDEARQISGNSS